MNNRRRGRRKRIAKCRVWEQGRVGKLLVLHKMRAGWRVQMGLERLCTGGAWASVALSGVLHQHQLGGL